MKNVLVVWIIILSSVVIQRHTDKPILKHLLVGPLRLLVNVDYPLQSIASCSAVAVSLLFEEICTISGSQLHTWWLYFS